MGRWREQFGGLEIEHLRSTVAAHPDPLDTYALGIFAEERGRAAEVHAMAEAHRDRTFHGPFAMPGSDLFDAFCDDCVHRQAFWVARSWMACCRLAVVLLLWLCIALLQCIIMHHTICCLLLVACYLLQLDAIDTI